MGNLWYGKRIQLKPIDENKLFQYLNSKDYYDSTYQRLASKVCMPLSLNKLKEEIEKKAKEDNKNDSYYWMIEDYEGNVVGDINTYNCSLLNGTFIFGVSINSRYWKKGYASEAIKIVLQFFFHELRYQKVNSYIYSFNEGSKRLHEKLGFKEEGRLRNMIYTNGLYYDHICYGMTKKEYERIKVEWV